MRLLNRIYLSSPHLGDQEFEFVKEAFATNWIAPLGPHVDAFEREFAAEVNIPHAAALSSGTAAIHLALHLLEVKPNDRIYCSSLTFSASVNPIIYEGAAPVFIDSERESWNMDPELLLKKLKKDDAQDRLPVALILVHLYGQSAQLNEIVQICNLYGVPVIEDVAEALGAQYWGNDRGPVQKKIAPGTVGKMGIYSFNGNKIITTSGGGMLVSDDKQLIERARFLATQARDQAPHYEHTQIGFNYRLSNVLAGIGRGQLMVLSQRVNQRRANYEYYFRGLGDVPGVAFMPEAPWGRSTRWLTCITFDPEKANVTREQVRLALADENIEARPVWKPMHRQPVFAAADSEISGVADELFERGLCLPSGSNLAREDLDRVITVVRRVCRA